MSDTHKSMINVPACTFLNFYRKKRRRAFAVALEDLTVRSSYLASINWNEAWVHEASLEVQPTRYRQESAKG